MTSLKKLAQIQLGDSSEEVFNIDLAMNTEIGIACFYLVMRINCYRAELIAVSYTHLTLPTICSV